MNQLTQDQQHAIDTIQYIATEVDYVPYPKEVYESLPEPHKSWALQELKTRAKNWKRDCENKKKSFE